jgi:hypothetical protein
VVPVVIGFTAVALLGVITTVVILKWQDAKGVAEQGPTTVPTGAATATAAATETPAPPATTPPATSSSAAPVKKIPVKLACIPACDEVKVDGAVVDIKKLELAPGKYEVEATKAGYVAQTGQVEVKEGSAVATKTFTLKAEPAAAPTATAASTGGKTGGGTSGGTSGGTTGGKTGGGTTGGKTGGGKNCKKVGFITKCS